MIKKWSILAISVCGFTFIKADTIKNAGELRNFWTKLGTDITTWKEEDAKTAKDAFEKFKSQATIKQIKPNFDVLYNAWSQLQRKSPTPPPAPQPIVGPTPPPAPVPPAPMPPTPPMPPAPPAPKPAPQPKPGPGGAMGDLFKAIREKGGTGLKKVGLPDEIKEKITEEEPSLLQELGKVKVAEEIKRTPEEQQMWLAAQKAFLEGVIYDINAENEYKKSIKKLNLTPPEEAKRLAKKQAASLVFFKLAIEEAINKNKVFFDKARYDQLTKLLESSAGAIHSILQEVAQFRKNDLLPKIITTLNQLNGLAKQIYETETDRKKQSQDILKQVVKPAITQINMVLTEIDQVVTEKEHKVSEDPEKARKERRDESKSTPADEKAREEQEHLHEYGYLPPKK